MRALLAALILLFTATVSAQEQIAPCADHDVMAAALLRVAKEHPVGIGITEAKSLMEIYASLQGTWTIVETDMMTGQSCIKSFGANYQGRLVPKPEQGA